MIASLLGRWKIAFETIAIIIALILGKLMVERFGYEFIAINPLLTSIIGGGIFLFGLILAGTLSDYKESERIPAEIISACESIYEDGLSTKEMYPEFHLDELRDTLIDVVQGFRVDAHNPTSRQALQAVSKLRRLFLEMERLGVPPNYITRLKTEAGAIRKCLYRVYYIQKINFLPSAYLLVESIVLLVMVLLVFTRIEPFSNAVIVLSFLTYIFVYISKLLKTLDTPFRGEKTRDDVSLFLLGEFEDRLRSSDNKVSVALRE